MCTVMPGCCYVIIFIPVKIVTDRVKRTGGCVQVVREEDIAEFFEQLRARKRQKTSESAMQYYCK